MLCLEAHSVLVRIGWIFKTETVIMPAVLDACVDSGLLRGLLPVLNRTGQSLPPLWAAGRIGRAPRLRGLLVWTTLGMAGSFGILAAAWWQIGADHPGVLAAIFLLLYTLFAIANGLHLLVAAALQGRLIAAGHRGRALMVSAAVGSVLAILAAWSLLGRWLEEPQAFRAIFATTGGFFALSMLPAAFLRESDVGAAPGSGGPVIAACLVTNPGPGPEARGLHAWPALLGRDPALLRLAVVAGCFAAVLMLFPHYQAYARDRLGSPPANLLVWVLVQNVATGLVGMVVGPIADRRGTRLVLLGLMAVSSVTPVLVSVLGLLSGPVASNWFWTVYLLLGLNPVSMRIFTNYALELAPQPADQARYVSLVGGALAVPFLLSPLLGWAVDAIGFEPVFGAGAAAIATGALVATGLPEPRFRPPTGSGFGS
jgi:hypothetical protein